MSTRSKIRLKKMDIAGSMSLIAYSSAAVMTPICLIKMMEEMSFNLIGGGNIEATRTLFILGILLLSGFAAAHWGKSGVLAFGSFALAAGMFAYAFAPVYAVIIVAMALVGIGSGVIEALVGPIVQDAHPTDSARYLNIVNAFWSIGVLTTVLVVGELLTRGVSWRLLMGCSGGLAVVSAVLSYAFRRSVPRSEDKDVTLASTWKDMTVILKHKRFWVIGAAFFAGAGAEATFTFWSATYVQIHYDALPRAGGLGTAIFAGGMIAGRMLTGHYVHQKGLKNLILFSGIAGIVVSIFVFIVGTLPGFYVCLFAAGLSVACFWPSIQSYAADNLPVDSTMLFILLSCAGIPGFGFASWLMGVIGELVSIRVSFAVIPFFFLVLVVIIFTDHQVHKKSQA